MPSSANTRSLDVLAGSLLTHNHIPIPDRPATPSTGESDTDSEPLPPVQLRSTITTDLVGQLSTIELPGIRTIDTNYDPSDEANKFRYRSKSMEERHIPTENLRKAASEAEHPKTFEAFDKIVSISFIKLRIQA